MFEGALPCGSRLRISEHALEYNPSTQIMTLGPYEILVVYRARDPRLERQVAIKLLPAEMAADHNARERLRSEAVAAAALDHPYICKIFESYRRRTLESRATVCAGAVT